MKIPGGGPLAKYHRVALALAARIREGFYAHGALPAERTLAAEFGVARVTVRHALRRLEDQGLLARHGLRGRVALLGPDVARRPRLLREHVDQFLDRGRPDQRKVLRFGSVRASAAVAQALALEEGARVLRVVRLRSRAGLPLTWTESFIPQPLAHALDRKSLAKKPLIQALEEGGIRIGAARQSVRAQRCPDEIAGPLGLSPYEPVLVLDRVVYDDRGAPVQLLRGWYRADSFDIQMEMSRADDLTRVWMRQRAPAG